MVILAVFPALGARVVCDPEQAARIVAEARIDEARAPVAHPELVPGLARRAAPDSPLAAVLGAWCASGEDLSVGPGVRWDGPRVAAHELVVTRATEEGCRLRQERLSLSVGVTEEGLTYHLLDRPPPDLTPGPDCDEEAQWRQATVLERQGPVLLRLLRDRQGDETVTSSEIEVWWASGTGWRRQTLSHPAPARYLRPDGGGSVYQLGRTADGETWVVASHDRTDPPCRGEPGQVVWALAAGRWQPVRGREALTRLAREGLWQLAGDDGWFLVVAQDEEADGPVLGPRLRRLSRRTTEPLYVYRSADFPLLNPGYLAIAPGPWPDRQAAEAFRAQRARRGAYVKQAWTAPDPCR